MDCPGCGVEMVSLAGDDQTIRKCGECGGHWMDMADLNRLLLHRNLPGLETLGGKVNPEAMTGQCPECHVDLMRIDGGDKHHPVHYDTCESCGGCFLESNLKGESTTEKAENEIVEFFRSFSSKTRKKTAGAA